MPYPGIPKDKEGEMESCVARVMADDPDLDKSGAIAICHNAIMGSTIVLEVLIEPVNFVVAQEDNGEVLRFRNAILAVAETNENRDTITEAEISNICAGLPGRPIDDDHNFDKCIGVFTEATPVKLGDTWAAMVGGLIWADRFPLTATGIRNGTLHLSVEARADEAECSICHGKFQSVVTYCEHLRDKLASGATRILHGLRAVGGAVTPNPAGTGTTFDRSAVYFVASHQEGSVEVIDIMDELQYDEIMAKVSPPGEQEGLKDSDFALIQEKDGKKLRRFPIQDCSHAQNALSQLSGAKDVSTEERATVKRKAQAKLNPPDQPKTEGSMSDLEVLQAQLKEMTEKYDAQVAAHAEVTESLAAATEQIVALTAKIEELVSKVTATETALAETVTAGRVQVLTLSGMPEEEVKEVAEVIATMNDAAFDLLLAKVKPAEGSTQVGSGGFTADTDQTKDTLVLTA